MPQNPTPAAAGDTTNPTTNLTPEREAEIRAREGAATPGPWMRDDDQRRLERFVTNESGTLDINFGYLGNNNQADTEFVADARSAVPELLAEMDRLRARSEKLETALAATGRSLSSFIFDADDPGADALGAQWLYWQAMPLVDDPFVQARMFRSSVFSEASKAVEEMDGNTPSERPQSYLDGYSDGLLDAAERLEKLADQAAEGSEPSAPSQREAGAL
ncbi:hypothetical protein [Streptomyces sp. f150]|uniref:hypothetical protein n=1 Tax=Streptomyces sp. f150 TaxID=1827699 RepID=UPI00117E8577|nr:hypothetical protein [Streptomyces sp. f150]